MSATHGVVLAQARRSSGASSSSVSAYANASRGFRSTDGLIVDPTLAPITAWAYEGGVKVDRAGASASAALFRMDVSNEQTFNPVRLVDERRREPAAGGGARVAEFRSARARHAARATGRSTTRAIDG